MNEIFQVCLSLLGLQRTLPLFSRVNPWVYSALLQFEKGLQPAAMFLDNPQLLRLSYGTHWVPFCGGPLYRAARTVGAACQELLQSLARCDLASYECSDARSQELIAKLLDYAFPPAIVQRALTAPGLVQEMGIHQAFLLRNNTLRDVSVRLNVDDFRSPYAVISVKMEDGTNVARKAPMPALNDSTPRSLSEFYAATKQELIEHLACFRTWSELPASSPITGTGGFAFSY